MHTKLPLVWVLGATLLLAGCFEEPDDNRSFGGNGNGNGNGNGSGSGERNQPPTIAGSPSANTLEGEFYEFLPSAIDPDGDSLEFSIARKPVWARFDRASGRLWGTPDANDVGNFTNIGISVSDGQAAASLAAFNVSVNQIAAGMATLSWSPPTENADGSALTDLAGYRVYYGRNANNLSQMVILNNPGLSRHVIENLTPARWHFAMTSVNGNGVESVRSQTTSKTIS